MKLSSYRLRRVATAGGVGLAVSGLGLIGPAVGGAATEGPPEEGGCPVVASAQGVQVMVSASDNLLLQVPSGAGVPVAQACVDHAVGDSSGFASAAYPGETIVSAPALLAGATGQPFPRFPAYAASRHPSNDEEAESGHGYALKSHSGANASESTARAGIGQDAVSAAATVASAKAVVDPSSRASTANAASDAQPVIINGVLELGRVQSSASATMREGKLERASALRVGRTTVADQTVEITPKGVRAAEETVAVPGAAEPVDALAAAGVQVRYLHEFKTARGILSAGIEIMARQNNPETGAVYTVHYIFGRAFAAAAHVEPEASAGKPDQPATSGGFSGSGSSSEVDQGESVDATAPVGSSSVPAEAPAAAVDAPQVAAGTETGAVLLAGKPADMRILQAYLTVLFGALAMVVGGTLLRLLGVKTR